MRSLKKAVGVGLVASPFVGLFAGFGYVAGPLALLGLIGFISGIVGVMAAGAYLIDSE